MADTQSEPRLLLPFLKERGVPLHYTLEDLEHDRQTHRRLGL